MGGTLPLKYTRSGYCLACCCAIPVTIVKVIMQVVIKVFMVLEFGGEKKAPVGYGAFGFTNKCGIGCLSGHSISPGRWF